MGALIAELSARKRLIQRELIGLRRERRTETDPAIQLEIDHIITETAAEINDLGAEIDTLKARKVLIET